MRNCFTTFYNSFSLSSRNLHIISCRIFNLGAYGTLTSYPEDIAVQRGNDAVFVCESNLSRPTNWQYRPLLSVLHVRLVVAGWVLDNLKDKVDFQQVGHLNILTIKNVSLSDAGSYECIDKVGMGETASAELIVLGKIEVQITIFTPSLWNGVYVGGMYVCLSVRACDNEMYDYVLRTTVGPRSVNLCTHSG